MPMLKKGFHVVALDLPGDGPVVVFGFLLVGSLGGVGSRKG